MADEIQYVWVVSMRWESVMSVHSSENSANAAAASYGFRCPGDKFDVDRYRVGEWKILDDSRRVR